MTQEEDRKVRATVEACIDPSRGTMVGMAFEAVYELAAQNLRMRCALERIVSDQDSEWSEDIAARALRDTDGTDPGKSPVQP